MTFRKEPVAWLALFFSLAGGAYAAVNIPPRSVGTRELKDRAVTNAKVKPHSLRARALAHGVLSGRGRLVTSVAPPGSCPAFGCETPAGTSMDRRAECRPDERIVSGGYDIPAGARSQVVASKSAPSHDLRAWEVTFTTTQDLPGRFTGIVYAICE